jgi:serine-type D-Ala-D-Ala carboxypeptidase (penicillin-binding protein 5/6)
MYGPIFSVLLMGMVPVWGLGNEQAGVPGTMFIAPPASEVTGELPVLTIPGKLSASGVVVLDLESGQMLYQRSAAVERPMASLTKLMTALLIVENHSLDDLVTIPADIGSVAGTTARLPAGDQVTVGNLLTALLVGSANDAALALARHHSGTEKLFVQSMNRRAKELGLKDTSYANASGLDDSAQRSTPRDTAWLAMFAWRFPEIASRMGMRGAEFATGNGVKISVTHTHALLHSDTTSVIAGKTGTTDGAGQCLLSVVAHEGRRYLVVLLYSDDRYADMRRILRVLVPESSGS